MAVAVAILAVACLVAVAWGIRQRTGAIEAINVVASRLQLPASHRADTLSGALARFEQVPEPDYSEPVVGPAGPQLEAALDSITQGVVVVDGDAAVVYRNPYAAAFMEGRHSNAVVADAVDDDIVAALAGEVIEHEVALFGPPRRTFLVSANPIAADEDIVGAVVLIDDVTETERLDAMRRDFVANISHELRTPVGAMSLLAETLTDESDPAVMASLSARIQGEAERMGRTIDDLLELSRIEHAEALELEPVTVQSAVREAVDSVSSAAEQRGVTLGVAMPDEPLVVEGDSRQLRTAFFNLVENAVKYSDSDTGLVSVRARARNNHVLVEVQDSGIGIPRVDLDRIFERFYRVDRARARTSGGTGLGLSIVRHVMANHGGRVDVESAEGEGTTFTLEFPRFVPREGVTGTRPGEVTP